MKLDRRLRRLRRTPALRRLVTETRLSPDQFILPLFVAEGRGVRRPVASMPGVHQLSVDEAVIDARAAWTEGVPAVLLFGLPRGEGRDRQRRLRPDRAGARGGARHPPRRAGHGR